MKTLLKITLGTIAVLLLLVVLALVFINSIINPNDYKPQLEKAVLDKTGFQMRINGDIGLTLFPQLSFAINDVSMLDRKQQPLLALEEAKLGLELWPLLSSRVEMNDVVLTGLNLKLVKDKTGKGNWEIPKQPETADQQKPQEQEPQEQEPSSSDKSQSKDSKPVVLAVESVQVKNMILDYKDEQAGTSQQIRNINFTTGAVASAKPFPINLSFSYNSSQPRLSLDSRLSATLMLDFMGQHYQMKELDWDLAAVGEPTNNKSVKGTIKGNLSVDLKQQLLSLNDWHAQFGDLDLTFTSETKQFVTAPAMSGKLSVKPLNIKQWLSGVGVEMPETASDKAFSQFALNTQFKGTNKQLSLSPLNITLDDSQLTGNLSIIDIASQALQFNLHINQFNVDDYLPPAPVETTKSAGAPAPTPAPSSGDTPVAASPAAEQPVIPVDALKGLNLAGQMTLKKLIVKKAELSDVKLDVSAKGGLVKVKNLSAKLYGGEFTQQLTVDVQGKQPTIKASNQLAGVQVNPLLTNLADVNQVSGVGNISSQITTKGLTASELTKQLNGVVKFAINDGQFAEVNINRIVCKTVAKVRKEKMGDQAWDNNTQFKSLHGQFNIRQGVAKNDDLIASLDQMKLDGDGEVDLVQQALDYHLGLTILGQTSDLGDQACRINERYANVRWPVRCKGKFSQKEGLCGVDSERMKDVAKALIKDELKRKVDKKLDDKLGDKLKEKLGEEGGERAKELLKGLFN
ncbi:AsmA family protein [Endozoicomonas sp. SM1973]|uniref:AsmA family protein n=1 Tax=Spartinivicinus marinus TaxID=2994442 RepID=A0A853HWB2_9GAMM|nr:AsmA family protein [Spartinivicinus marinus]MCX4027238.1 AsmA family protein [Spartinivicinus marinus]NYZ66040.1 AsmA family protein [Spartinivicinus marinus]